MALRMDGFLKHSNGTRRVGHVSATVLGQDRGVFETGMVPQPVI